MWPLLQKCLKVVIDRNTVGDQFAELIGVSKKKLILESRYESWVKSLNNIKFNDALQREILEDIYNYHAFLFHPLFPELDEPTVHTVSFAGRLYSDYQIILDRLIDSETKTSPHLTTLQADFLHDRSMRLLYELFPPSSNFWLEFQSLKKSMITANLLEKNLQNNDYNSKKTDLEAVLRKITQDKSSIAKCSPLALATLTGNTNLLPEIYSLFDKIAIVAQFMDDFSDWEQDIAKGQLSYLLYLFADELDTDIFGLAQLDNLKAKFYLSNSALLVLTEAQENLVDVSHSSIFAECDDWKRILNIYHDWCTYTVNQIKTFRKRVSFFKSQGVSKEPLKLALQFMQSSQRDQGYWPDFLTTAGESKDWVTGYVGKMLEDIPNTDILCRKASEWLLHRSFPSGGWGYSREVVADCDSTAFCLLFLQSYLKTAKKHLAKLQTFQHENGGYSTYIDASQIAPIMHLDANLDFSGWCSPQVEVTSLAILANMTFDDSQQNLKDLKKHLDYLLNHQREDGGWNAYWWYGDKYSTSYTIEVLYKIWNTNIFPESNEHIKDSIDKGLNFLRKTQRESGAWGAVAHAPECPFQTALALRAILLTNQIYLMPVKKIENAKQYLMDLQEVNGSWSAQTPIMQLPLPNQKDPWAQQMAKGTFLGQIVTDQNGYFTTATVMKTLHLLDI